MDRLRESEIKEFVSELLHRHYCKNDVDYIIGALGPEVTWFGAGEEQYLHTREEVERFFLQNRGAIPPCKIWDEQYQVTGLAPDLYLCDGMFWVATDESSGMLLKVHQRVSFVLRRIGGALKCVHVHCSNPYQELSEGELFPDKVGRTTYEYMEQRVRDMERQLEETKREIMESAEEQKKAYEELRQRNWQMQVILTAIKGGLKISRDDAFYSYQYVSDELCALFGYTPAEFLAVTGGTAVGAVYAPDLDRVLGECELAFRDGKTDYAIKYRIRCKDGSLKWIIDSGRKVQDENGETIINSLYLDITEIEEANQKIAAQKEFLDSIYGSIMCGILRYRLRDDRSFEFVSMNREAMRILGYQSEQECFALGVEAFFGRICKEERAVLLDRTAGLKNGGDSFHLEYRIRRPDGGTNWVYGTSELLVDTDGKNVVQRIMIDISEKKQLELALEDERQRFRIAIESTPAVIFEYDPAADHYTAYGTLEVNVQKHNVELLLDRFLAQQAQELVAPADLERFCALMRGEAGNRMELQMAPYYGSGELVWAKIDLTPVCKGGRRPVKMIGKITNIQSEKEMESALEEAKSRDALTGLYAKDVGIRMAQEHLTQKPQDENCVLMLLDMDNFKQLNAEEGSVFADAILQETADILKACTKPEDIQIRLGGDEFMLLIKDCDKACAVEIGPEIARQVGRLFRSEEKGLHVSVSIGMCSTEVAEEYVGLYRCAESTLKYVKEHGKGRAACYLDTSNEVGAMLTQFYTERHLINTIDRQTSRHEADLVSFALELLGKARNLDDAVFLLLARIGKVCGLDRVSILEDNPEYLSYHFSYQWARNPADLLLGREFYLTQEDFEMVNKMYDEDGLCDFNINAGISDFPSCLHAAIWDHGKYAGALDFESRQPNFPWTQECRKLLKELVKIIPSFIMKARADAVSQAKTDFLSRMSHEIRTPMNAISGMTTIAKTVLENREKALDCLEKIESANDYLIHLVNDILDMSRIESGKVELYYERLDLGQWAGKLETLMRPQAQQKQLELCFQNLCAPGYAVMADSLRLNQVLVNIIGNAIKFTRPGGRVTVRMEPLENTDSELLLRFSVRDTGIGIQRDALGRIFNAFEQAEGSTATHYGGTGLGLSISSRLVQMMGGVLEVSSEPGKGSEFYFTLCLERSAAPEETPAAPPPDAGRPFDFTGKRVLLVEDNELNREIAEEILQMNGFITESAEDGKQALELFAASAPGYYEAILMDIRMPVMDGLEATRRIRTLGKEDSRTVPIIAMSANAFDEDTKKSIESGMNGHLSKPVQVERLLEMLRDCMGG